MDTLTDPINANSPSNMAEPILLVVTATATHSKLTLDIYCSSDELELSLSVCPCIVVASLMRFTVATVEVATELEVASLYTSLSDIRWITESVTCVVPQGDCVSFKTGQSFRRLLLWYL